ncbi:DNA polymerase delta, subunit 4-domain-containing protein [Phellopilus nigrolimitatus]|nr:DNA polymerase delta, subunit 4-domain-containing protein [Phellopilus nigrolimitatus]
MASKSRSSSTALSLKQGTLSFASSKRGATATATGKANVAKAGPAITASRPASAQKRSTGARTASSDSTISLGTSTSSASDSDVVMLSAGSTPAAQHGIRRSKIVSSAPKSVGAGMKRKVRADDSSSDEEHEEPKANLDLLEKSGRLSKIYGQARERMGNIPPIHAEKQTKSHHILRIFDNSYEYGPCVGMTRLQRWERAQSLGMNPPMEIRDILVTEEGNKDDTYKHSVFYGDV